MIATSSTPMPIYYFSGGLVDNGQIVVQMRMQTNRLSVFGESERSDLPSQTEVEMLVISCAGCSLDNDNDHDHAPARTTLPLS
eukprot:scaffold1658_cov160-Skeletonema_menzelii.AAC.1